MVSFFVVDWGAVHEFPGEIVSLSVFVPSTLTSTCARKQDIPELSGVSAIGEIDSRIVERSGIVRRQKLEG